MDETNNIVRAAAQAGEQPPAPAAAGASAQGDLEPGLPVSDHSACRAVSDILGRVGDKWTVMLVGSLAGGPLRYNQLHRLVHGISQRMLTLTLKGLEQDGLVTRTMYPTIPPRVDYELTALGQSLIVPLRSLHQWATLNGAAMSLARAQYAQRQSENLGKARFTDPK